MMNYPNCKKCGHPYNLHGAEESWNGCLGCDDHESCPLVEENFDFEES